MSKDISRALRSACCFLFAMLVTNPFVYAQDTMFIDRSESSGMQDETIYRQLGVAWGDFDADGLLDVFIATAPNNRLFKNLGNNEFRDDAEAAGVQDMMAEASVGVWGDYDADGDLDLFVGNLNVSAAMMGGELAGVQNRLYNNNGGVFTDVAASAGVAGDIQGVTGGTTSASWADYDRDGWIDLLVCNRLFGVFLYRNLGDGTFQEVSQQAGLHTLPNPSIEHGAWADYDRDGALDLFLSAGTAMMMTMTEDSMSSMSSMPMLAPMQMDGMMSANRLYRNQGDGTFREVTEEAGLIFETNMARSHTAVWGDFDNDGYPDLFSGNRGSITAGTLAPSKLYRNNRDGTFSDYTQAFGMNDEFSVFGAAWGDVNNDGMLDLYIAIHPDMRDYPDHHINPTRIPHPLYMAQPDGTWKDVNQDIIDLPYVSGITDLGHQGGAAFGDADNDGDLDLVVVEAMGLGPMRFYENANAALGNHWITIELRSDTPNTRAIGAKIMVESEGQRQYRDVGFGSAGWASEQPYEQNFGLGPATEASVSVVWPDGTTQEIGSMTVDQKHWITHDSTAIVNWPLY